MSVPNSTAGPHLTTTIFAANIHCSGCVSHVERAIRDSALSQQVTSFSVSLVSGEITLDHDTTLSVREVCREISEAAFEISEATTIDHHGQIISEVRFGQSSDGPLNDATERLRHSLPRSSNPLSPTNLLPLSLGGKRRRYPETCPTCQQKEADSSHASSVPSLDLKDVALKHSSKVIVSERPAPSISEESSDDEQRFAVFSFNDIQKGVRTDDEAEAAALSSPDEWKCELSIVGMTCSACTNAVQDALKQIDQVDEVVVKLLTNSATVIFHSEKDIGSMLVDAVEEIGFEASVFTSERVPAVTSARKDSDASTLVELRRGSTSSMMKAKLSIGGMTCSACTNAVTGCLKELTFVQDSTVYLMTNSAEIFFEGDENLPKLVEAVEDAGFDCSVEEVDIFESETTNTDAKAPISLERQVQIAVSGFYCQHCPTRVVQHLEANYSHLIKVSDAPTIAHPVITVTYTPDQGDLFTIRNVVRAVAEADPVHFEASIYHPPSIEERSREVQIHERRRLLIRLIISTIVAIPTFVVGVVLMDLLPRSNSLRKYIMEPAWSGIVPRAQWALLILATPVYFFAADVFHRRAIKEIKTLWNPRRRVSIVRRLTRFGSMNLLVSAGTTVAYVSSVGLLISDAVTSEGRVGTSMQSSTTYFDTVVFLTFFILIGRFLEAYSKSKAGDAISMLGNRKPQEAILKDESGNQSIIAADLLEIGDEIVVPHGQSPAADGILVDDNALLDESSLTGESRSVEKQAGDDVFTGTINVGPPVVVRVTKTGGTSMLDQIINVVREGQTRRAPVEKIADCITGYFVPIITALAILTFIVWVSLGYSGALDRKYLGGVSGGWAFWSLEFAIAVFVVACPCGIGLAAPTALFVGSGLAAKHGILARGGGQAFQDAGTLDAIVFDKTGTLTEGGDLKVTNTEFFADVTPVRWSMTLVHTLELASAHPIAVAIAHASRRMIDASESESKLPRMTSSKIIEVPGRGMEGVFETEQGTWKAKIGSPTFIKQLLAGGRLPADSWQLVNTWEHESKTVIALAVQAPNTNDWTLSAVLAVEDAIRDSARPAVTALRKRDLEVYMLTGDNWATAKAVASRVGIKPENVFAGVLPTEKADKIEWLQNNLRKQHATTLAKSSASASESSLPSVDIEKQDTLEHRRSLIMSLRRAILGGPLRKAGHFKSPFSSDQDEGHSFRKANVAFVGDGINDAPALTRADISISPSNGAPIATNSSSFILMSPSLMAIPQLFDISSKVFRRVKFNFTWALIYNVVLVPVAAGVFFKVKEDGFRLGPVWGSLAMALSSVSVVVSSLLLRWERPWPWQWFVRK